MQEVQDHIEAAGATLVALCPQLAEKTRAMVEKHNLTFDILTDAGNDYAAELGIKFQVPDDVKTIYEGFGLDLPGTNGDDSWTLPIPSRLVIDGSGVVRAADIHPNYTTRPEPEKTLADLEALG